MKNLKNTIIALLLISSATVQAKQVYRDTSYTYVDMDYGWVEMVSGLGYTNVVACLATTTTLCAYPLYGSLYRFSNVQINQTFGIAPYNAASVSLIFYGQKPPSTGWITYNAMVDYEFWQGQGTGFRVDNIPNKIAFWSSAARPK